MYYSRLRKAYVALASFEITTPLQVNEQGKKRSARSSLTIHPIRKGDNDMIRPNSVAMPAFSITIDIDLSHILTQRYPNGVPCHNFYLTRLLIGMLKPKYPDS